MSEDARELAWHLFVATLAGVTTWFALEAFRSEVLRCLSVGM